MQELLQTAGAALGTALFILGLLAGLVLSALGFPGTLLILVDAVLFLFLREDAFPTRLAVTLAVLTLVAETADNVVGAVGSRRYGASGRGIFWAMVGGIAGAFLSGATIGPLLGVFGLAVVPVIGGLAGGWFAAFAYERRSGRAPEEARRAAMGAVLGRLAGTLLRVVLAAAMVVIALLAAF